MSLPDQFYKDFKTISKEEWMEKIEKDLKGKPFEGLLWELESDEKMVPIFHSDDSQEGIQLPLRKQEDNEWEIATEINIDSPAIANKQMLTCLMGGVQSLNLVSNNAPSDSDLDLLFKGIEPDFISTHFELPNGAVGSTLNAWTKYLKEKGKSVNAVKGSCSIDPFATPDGLDRGLALYSSYSNDFDHFKLIRITETPYSDYKDISLGLAKLVAKLSDWLAHGDGTIRDFQHLKIRVLVGTNFFVELSKLRALKLLIAHLAKAYKLDGPLPEIEANLSDIFQQENPNSNMIQAATQAMSAVMAGVDRLYILPSGSDKGGIDFQQRIARNVQHLLKMESYLDRVQDPAAGSYYIENLTRKLATLAWEKFQEIEKKGGYKKVF